MPSPRASLNFMGRLFERLGLIGNLTLWSEYNFCDSNGVSCPTLYDFNCYYDPELGMYSTRPQKECEHWLILTGREKEAEISENSLVTIPKPAKNTFNIYGINSPDFPSYFQILDVTSRIVSGGILMDESSLEINISELAPGINTLIFQTRLQLKMNRIILE